MYFCIVKYMYVCMGVSCIHVCVIYMCVSYIHVCVNTALLAKYRNSEKLLKY